MVSYRYPCIIDAHGNVNNLYDPKSIRKNVVKGKRAIVEKYSDDKGDDVQNISVVHYYAKED